MSESEIVKLFGGVTLKETSGTLDDTSGKLKKEDTLSTSSSSSLGELKSKKKKKKKKKTKKEEALRKLSSGGVIKKKSNNAGVFEEQRKLRFVDWWNEDRGKVLGLGKMFYGVGRSVLGTMFFTEITHPDGRLLHLGTFKSERLAALAYDQAAFQIYGPQATLNFPPNNN